MALFYAYLKHVETSGLYQQIITFVNRETADEWWRMISAPPSPFAGSIKRISPQFYVQKGPGNAAVFVNQVPDSPPLWEKMLSNYISTNSLEHAVAIPPADVPDHISGHWYFIRSKVDPFSHWYLRTNGTCLICGDADCDAVHVSNEHHTKFRIRVRGPIDDSQNFVMIGKDEISIVARRDLSVHINDAEGDLKATRGYQGETDLLFGDLKNRFITRGEKQVNGEIWEYVESVERGSGEAWELVE